MPNLKRLYILIFILVYLIFLPINPSFAGYCDECNNSGGPSTVSGNYEEPPGWKDTFRYDPDNPQTVERNDSVTINVIGGKSPYTWVVSGTGFSLDQPETTELSNQLNADSTACGSAEITVTDNDGVPVTGSVREPNDSYSKWIEQPELENTCPEPGVATSSEWAWGATRIVGKIKIREEAVQGQDCRYSSGCDCDTWQWSGCEGLEFAPNCSPRGTSRCITASPLPGGRFLNGYGYGCMVDSKWCWCVCNKFTRVSYWECR
jgi:hypothetical protein